ncbi:MAG TPA: hypothetical protein VK338_02870 [Candidatus Nitrosocosmicus sp.]|nr:hypothetical protein [Candidatus Nitrosocosmicus sp.]
MKEQLSALFGNAETHGSKEGIQVTQPTIHLVLAKHEFGIRTHSNIRQVTEIIESYLPHEETKDSQGEGKKVCVFIEDAEGRETFAQALYGYSLQGLSIWDSFF